MTGEHREDEDQLFDALIWGIELLTQRSFERLTSGEITHEEYCDETETLRRFTALVRAWLECDRAGC
jgi:hypothetical protein